MKDSSDGSVPHKSASDLTVAQIKELRSRSAQRGKGGAPPSLVPRKHSDGAALSYAQERLWVLDQLGLVGSAYNSQMAFRLDGDLEIAALERSLTDLLQRHESLRTHFESRAGTPVQMVDAAQPFLLEVQYFSEGHDVQEEVERVGRAEAQRAFDLTKSPLLRASLLAFSTQTHVLLLTLHHIVTDGWSWGVVQRELAELYEAHVQGREPSLAALPIQYVDYAIWQREWLTGDILDEQLTYWREQLKGAPSMLAIPTDRTRTTATSYAGGRFKFDLSAALTSELHHLARGEGATLFMLVLAAFQLLISRHCNQLDIVIGAPIANRRHPSIEGLIGFFVNTLVLRTDLSGNPSFRALLARVRAMTLGAYAHQDLPFEKLVTELRPERKWAGQPIFQVALAMQNYPERELSTTGLTWTRIQPEHASAVFDLTLHVREVAGGLSGMFVYATDLFDSTTIERMSGHFRTLLERIAADPDRPIQRIAMLRPDEHDVIVNGFNNTNRPYPREKAVHEVFEDFVRQAPHAVACMCDERSLTYDVLNNKANRFAHYLVVRGVQPGEFIPIVMHRSPEMLIAQLATLKSGAAYVPLDPLMPIERQAFIIRNCGARYAILGERLRPIPVSEPIQWIEMTSDTAALDRFPVRDLRIPVPASAAAYVMYTSGTTGAPKGVVVPHRAITRLVINNGYADIDGSDCVAHYSNPSFDASTFEVWGALLNGARILIVPQPLVLDSARFSELLLQHGVTVLWMTVGLFAQYAAALPAVFGHLRYLIVGGDVVEPSSVRRALRNCPPRNLLNGYGPTECTTFSTTHLIEDIGDQNSNIPIGKPVSNTKVYVLTAHLEPTPIGVIGEIYVGGDGVALGYLNSPGLTADRFVADPYSTRPGARMYRTGDLGRWRTDGSIEFVGRNDRQVKIRGFRIELGEVESQLLAHQLVKEAVVLVRIDPAGEKSLAAFLTLRAENGPGVDVFRDYLKTVLPEYMIPGAIVIMQKMPLTSNGKVDRDALPDPGIDAYATRRFEAPIGHLEANIARTWQELLGVDRVGRHDSFFELGGHSLLVLKTLFTINQRLASDLKASDIYRNPTVVELARRISTGNREDAFVDLSQEASLDEKIVATSAYLPSPLEHLLLTGATGFVGRFLLTALLQNTSAIIYCLIRGNSSSEALFRLRTTLEKWDLWRNDVASRIVAIPGDLRLPRFGIDEQTYDMLSTRVSCVYHCGTSMNHLETYEMAKAANVGSAREVLKFAAHRKLKLINYVSTLSVFSSLGIHNTRIIDETSPIDQEKHCASQGYMASKWVSEKILMKGRERGIPSNIFRLGLVWADTRKGRYDERQRDYRLIKSCLLLGKGIKGYRYELPPTPVDFVAGAMLALARRHHSGGGIFHLSAARQVIEGVFERHNDMSDTQLELLPIYDWICEVKRLHERGTSLPIVPLIEFAFALDETSYYERQRRGQEARPCFDSTRTLLELEDVGVTAPVFDGNLLALCIQDMLARDSDLRPLIEGTRKMAGRAPVESA